MKQKYIMLTTFFPTPQYNREFFVYEQVRAIEEEGKFEVIVFKPKKWYSSDKDYEYMGTKVFYFKTFELPSSVLPGLFDFLSIWSFKQKLKSCEININSVAVVHAHLTSLGIFANALKDINYKIQSLLQHHGFDVLSLENGIFSRLNLHRKLVEKYGINIINKIDLQVVVSKKHLEFLSAYKDILIKDYFVLYNGVNTKKFYPITGLKDSRVFTIGCVGIFWSIKDQITLLKATKLLTEQGLLNFKVKLVGQGTNLDLCKLYVKENNLELIVEFIPFITHNDLVLFYNSLDLFVLPSYHEAFGCVYMEAHACGIPFIAVKEQGISELIPDEDKQRWLIPKKDEIKLASLIIDYKKFKIPQILNQNLESSTLIKKFLERIN